MPANDYVLTVRLSFGEMDDFSARNRARYIMEKLCTDRLVQEMGLDSFGQPFKLEKKLQKMENGAPPKGIAL